MYVYLQRKRPRQQQCRRQGSSHMRSLRLLITINWEESSAHQFHLTAVDCARNIFLRNLHLLFDLASWLVSVIPQFQFQNPSRYNCMKRYQRRNWKWLQIIWLYAEIILVSWKTLKLNGIMTIESDQTAVTASTLQSPVLVALGLGCKAQPN